MGIIFSRFRRKQSTMDVLQQIEDEMAAIEEYKTGARRRQQRLSAVIVAYSVVLYLVAGLLLYYHYFPDDMTTRLLCAGALLLFPAVVYVVKKLVMWYYGRKISKNELKSASLKKKKETILEEVQDKETYKVAKRILEKFAPEQLRRSPLRPAGPLATPSQQGSFAAAAMRHRQLASSAMAARTPLPITPLGRAPPQPGSGGRYASQVVQSPMPGVPGRMLQPQPGGPRAGPPLPRPVLPRERGVMDRMVDFLVGDGPTNRYALICCQCQSHNGMALKEEFEYLAFRCCYCLAWNPARKQRPSAPRLPAAPTSGESMVESDTTETSESETDGQREASSLSPGTTRPDSPASELSSEQAGKLPSEPAGELPSEPAGELPSEQAGELPSEQAGELPSEPAGELPSEQAGELSSEQAGELPSEQAGELPSEQAGEQTGTAEGLEEPATDQPVPAPEQADLQTEPTMEQPELAAEERVQPELVELRPGSAEQAELLEEASLTAGAAAHAGDAATLPSVGRAADDPTPSGAEDQTQDPEADRPAPAPALGTASAPALGTAQDVPFADDSGADS